MTPEEALVKVRGYLTDYLPLDSADEIDEIIKALEQPSRNCSSCKHSDNGKCAYTEECHECMWDNKYEQQPCDKCVYSTKDGYCQYDDIAETIPTEQQPCKGMRDATEEECKSTKDYIDSISKPTGLRFDDIYEELDFVQPHKKISANLRIGKSIKKVRNNMKIIVLHDKYSNEPIVIRPDAIIAVRTIKDEEQEYSEIVMVAYTFIVKETIGDIINKIKKVESEINIDE